MQTHWGNKMNKQEYLDNFFSPFEEKCGIILTSGQIIGLENTHKDLESNFSMVIPEREDILAFWHSHNTDNSQLSTDDYLSFIALPDHLHIIFCHTNYSIYYNRNGMFLRKLIQLQGEDIVLELGDF